ncbi:MAG: hypothetical protein FWE21_09710, partial [Defluviitaleaceae bacterium]|nr:hypothetical protein [Defluviitaleaceae bacterium]
MTSLKKHVRFLRKAAAVVLVAVMLPLMPFMPVQEVSANPSPAPMSAINTTTNTNQLVRGQENIFRVNTSNQGVQHPHMNHLVLVGNYYDLFIPLLDQSPDYGLQRTSVAFPGVSVTIDRIPEGRIQGQGNNRHFHVAVYVPATVPLTADIEFSMAFTRVSPGQHGQYVRHTHASTPTMSFTVIDEEPILANAMTATANWPDFWQTGQTASFTLDINETRPNWYGPANITSGEITSLIPSASSGWNVYFENGIATVEVAIPQGFPLGDTSVTFTKSSPSYPQALESNSATLTIKESSPVELYVESGVQIIAGNSGSFLATVGVSDISSSFNPMQVFIYPENAGFEACEYFQLTSGDSYSYEAMGSFLIHTSETTPPGNYIAIIIVEWAEFGDKSISQKFEFTVLAPTPSLTITSTHPTLNRLSSLGLTAYVENAQGLTIQWVIDNHN